jgi:hypothetical protein
MKNIIHFFDKLEDHVRAGLSHYPLFYSFIGGTGVILFWRGVWHTADYFEESTFIGSVIFSDIGSMILGICILLITGLFVSVFIGDSIIMSGIRGDKKLIEKSELEIEEEIKKEKKVMGDIQKEIQKIEKKINL